MAKTTTRPTTTSRRPEDVKIGEEFKKEGDDATAALEVIEVEVVEVVVVSAAEKESSPKLDQLRKLLKELDD